ncbi:MAG: hypothetical protein EOP49_52930 [Sphingobacteriales bacterium]|nr:MAG: hypothetical protein EOP49_52930 [Sphingobacteriales bacterium]
MTPVEGSMMKSLLESEDIWCYLKDEHTVTAAPYMSNMLKGIKLQVRPVDKDRAVEVLKQGGYFEDEKPDTTNYARQGAIFVLIMIALLVALYLWHGKG